MKLIGNSVSVPVIEMIGKAILQALQISDIDTYNYHEEAKLI